MCICESVCAYVCVCISVSLCVSVSVCVCVCLCVYVCVCECVAVCVPVSLCVRACLLAWYLCVPACLQLRVCIRVLCLGRAALPHTGAGAVPTLPPAFPCRTADVVARPRWHASVVQGVPAPPARAAAASRTRLAGV